MGTRQSLLGLVATIGIGGVACGGVSQKDATIGFVGICSNAEGSEEPATRFIVNANVDEGFQARCRVECPGNTTTELVFSVSNARFEGERTGKCFRYDVKLTDSNDRVVDAAASIAPDWYSVLAKEEATETVVTWTPAGDGSQGGNRRVDVFISGEGGDRKPATSGPDDGEERLPVVGLSKVKVAKRWTESARNVEIEYSVTATVN